MGTEWLLSHLVLNMEKVELEYKRSMLMESTISQLHGELIRMEIKKRSNKELKMEVDNEKRFQDSKKEMEKEKSIERLIMNHTSAIYPENERKGNLASRILGCLSFYDRNTQRLERTGKVMVARCNDLKRAVISKYEAVQKNKNEMLRMKREVL